MTIILLTRSPDFVNTVVKTKTALRLPCNQRVLGLNLIHGDSNIEIRISGFLPHSKNKQVTRGLLHLGMRAYLI